MGVTHPCPLPDLVLTAPTPVVCVTPEPAWSTGGQIKVHCAQVPVHSGGSDPMLVEWRRRDAAACGESSRVNL